jgi:hypothetical protein
VLDFKLNLLRTLVEWLIASGCLSFSNFLEFGLWRERNQRTFEGVECSNVELKRLFLVSLYEWMAALSSPFSSLEKFLDLCSFR